MWQINGGPQRAVPADGGANARPGRQWLPSRDEQPRFRRRASTPGHRRDNAPGSGAWCRSSAPAQMTAATPFAAGNRRPAHPEHAGREGVELADTIEKRCHQHQPKSPNARIGPRRPSPAPAPAAGDGAAPARPSGRARQGSLRPPRYYRRHCASTITTGRRRSPRPQASVAATSMVSAGTGTPT